MSEVRAWVKVFGWWVGFSVVVSVPITAILLLAVWLR